MSIGYLPRFLLKNVKNKSIQGFTRYKYTTILELINTFEFKLKIDKDE